MRTGQRPGCDRERVEAGIGVVLTAAVLPIFVALPGVDLPPGSTEFHQKNGWYKSEYKFHYSDSGSLPWTRDLGD